MSQPVYVFMSLEPNEAYYQIADKDAFWAKLRTDNENAGVEAESIINCVGIDGGARFLTVSKFPSMEAYEKWRIVKRKEQASRYFDAEFMRLGIESEDWSEMTKAIDVAPI